MEQRRTRGGVVRGGADDLDAALVGAVVGPRALKGGQEGVVDVCGARVGRGSGGRARGQGGWEPGGGLRTRQLRPALAHRPVGRPAPDPPPRKRAAPLTDGVLPVPLAEVAGEDLHVPRQHNQVHVLLLHPAKSVRQRRSSEHSVRWTVAAPCRPGTAHDASRVLERQPGQHRPPRELASTHLQDLLDLRLLRRLAGRVPRRDGQVAVRHAKPLGNHLQLCCAGGG